MPLFRFLSKLRSRPSSPPSDDDRLTDDVEPDEGFDDLLASIGAELVEEPSDQHRIELEKRLALRDATIGELQTMLIQLRPLGEELAQVERERIELTARVAELEESLAEAQRESEHSTAKLERKLQQREGVLARERKRLENTRQQLADKKRIASERWHTLRELRSENKRLLAELAACGQPRAGDSATAPDANPSSGD